MARVERGPLTAAVSATGNLNAVITVQVGSQVSGQIKELLVDFNSIVKKNQVIARIDPEIFEAKVNQAKADLASAQRRRAEPGGPGRAGPGRRGERPRGARRGQGATPPRPRCSPSTPSATTTARRELFGRELIAKSDLDTLAGHVTTPRWPSSTRPGRKRAGAQLPASSPPPPSSASTEAALESARAQVRAEGGRAPAGPGRPRPHDDPGARRRRRRLAAGRRRPDRGGQPAGAGALHDRPGPDPDAGRDQRGRGGHRPDQARRPRDLHGRRVPGARRSSGPSRRSARPRWSSRTS